MGKSTFHLLGFSIAYFRARPIRDSDVRYAYGNGTLNYESIDGREKEAAFIVLPTVKKMIRQFFDCEDMIGDCVFYEL